ncbi:23S rRNA (pseudouridine(1915)-N(3))-methyltransferase RlmH [Candidatus Saccharibacteria bacterium]|nr:23S rRNA (pseudouridine(1915)-N(3))-methyltransferase RlmH [Candidatus Saccharibacteria bacterium]
MSSLPNICLISVSKPKGAWANIVELYSNRLTKITKFEHKIVKEIGDTPQETRDKTSRKIIELVPQNWPIILLDETGSGTSSTSFADLINDYQHVCIIVGSSYGVSDELKQISTKIIRLSDMVLAHEIARVLILEQLYRAHTINTNHPYHHS